MVNHLMAICLAYILDLIIGDPKNLPHPVKAMGSYISWCEKRLNHGRNKRIKGIIMLFSMMVLVCSISLIILYFAYQWHPALGIVLEGMMIMTTIAQKSLREAAIQVMKPLHDGNLIEARRHLSYIVGRDTEELSESEIVRATVETVAENTSDGITAPLFWAAIGGAPLALVYRAVNTCDSMVGYKNKQMKDFGWASARFDDVVNWLPARLTALLMMITMKPEKMSRKQSWLILFKDAKQHASPNSGWGEAAVASLLGVKLGGMNSYQGVISPSPTIGKALEPLTANHIAKTIAIMSRTVVLFIIAILLGGIIYEITSPWL